MDALAGIPTENPFDMLNPTIEAFLPKLKANSKKYEGIEKRTFKYGDGARQDLDVYLSPSSSESPKHKLAFWIYGGAHVSGSRSFDPPRELGYGNVGRYFASKGYTFIIPDYRLVSLEDGGENVRFPAQARDILTAMEWVLGHPESYATEGSGQKDVEVFVMGHSAGGTNALTLFLLPSLVPSHPKIMSRVRGVVSIGTTYTYPSDPNSVPPPIKAILDKYYGNIVDARPNGPLGLYLSYVVSATGEATVPNLLIVESEHEPSGIHASRVEFESSLKTNGWGKDGKKVVDMVIAKGHNHISINWALGSGEGENWANEVVQWMDRQT